MKQEDREWFIEQIGLLDPTGSVVTYDAENNRLHFSEAVRSGETRNRDASEPEELTRALIMCRLTQPEYGYKAENFSIEETYTIGHPTTSGAQVDLIIYDGDDQPFVMCEIKEPAKYVSDEAVAIKHQLFATAPQVHVPSCLVYATYRPHADDLEAKTIDYSLYKDYDEWVAAGGPCT